MSLLRIFDIPVDGLFGYENFEVEGGSFVELDYSMFKHFPFVILNIEQKYHKYFHGILERSISISYLVELLAHGSTLKEL